MRRKNELQTELFAGEIGYFKNPLSHRELNIDDASIAASRIMLANDLIYTLAAHVEKTNPHNNGAARGVA